ncbi:MAG: pyridoxal-phosphate dependent enzyme [Woeseiaceae bacterium]|nr:pyridoxal-phosphate dependent enzyme [Woeseiaceae bacterium]
MTSDDELLALYPELGRQLERVRLADLPTPVRAAQLAANGRRIDVLVKQDDVTAKPYGGNKVRKLEYLLARARRRRRRTIATFGTAGSHHALATAVYAKQQGFDCLCFLSRQARDDAVARTLEYHLQLGTELVPFGGGRSARIATLRRHLRGRRAAVIPAGGSSWLGTIGFVNAALELVAQIGRGECPCPERVYVATGTMGTAAGLALGFALAGIGIEVHAVRISPARIASREKFDRLAAKTALMMHRLDGRVPASLADRLRVRWRDGFFGPGYARSDARTDRAMSVARRELALELEATYTGKAMAALVDDVAAGYEPDGAVLFWQTWHGAPLPAGDTAAAGMSRLPAAFSDYFS